MWMVTSNAHLQTVRPTRPLQNHLQRICTTSITNLSVRAMGSPWSICEANLYRIREKSIRLNQKASNRENTPLGNIKKSADYWIRDHRFCNRRSPKKRVEYSSNSCLFPKHTALNTCMHYVHACTHTYTHIHTNNALHHTTSQYKYVTRHFITLHACMHTYIEHMHTCNIQNMHTCMHP